MAYDILQEQITIPVPGDSSPIDAYIARPRLPGRYAGAIVGMELFGVNDHIRDITDRVARLGYIAVAPNFYHRTLPGESLPFSDEGRTQGFEHLNKLSRSAAMSDVRAIIDFLREDKQAVDQIGFLGFSVGGNIAYLAATQFDIAACACFYGSWLTNTDIPISQPEPPILLTSGIAQHNGRIIYFVGELDHVISQEQRMQISEALKSAHVRHEMVVYPETKHGFFCDQRETFHKSSRDDAWKRVQKLFAEELRAAEYSLNQEKFTK